MGRLATAVAAAGADAINIPPIRELPRISLLDALMPKSWSDLGKAVKAAKASELLVQSYRKPKPPAREEILPRAPVTYYEVKKNRNGSRSLVAHRGAIGSTNGEKVTENNVKKDHFGDQKANGKGDTGNQPKAGASRESKGAFRGNDVPWTADEDAKIKAMKAEGKTWKEIATELNRAKGQVSARFREINTEEGAGNTNGQAKDNAQKNGNDANKQSGDQNNDNAANKGGGKKGKKDKSANDNNAKQDKKQNDKKSQPSKLAAEDARFTMADWQTLQEDDLFSFGELQCLSEIIAKDPEMSWPRIAARFFDITGRRVHADDVREKFEGLAEKAYGS
ncbi:hypothetical protein B0A48_02892 [Cryoendolithus antarcticus]|uniref:Myb-like domain-containing protein n=1 Tax=Cryoendolithus antarcticus TaxID=1507870 RepID=A0A1V8TLX3_9PEZI|nr:hypothetical protein B0A48_02892 [Cryoendolithus antarcticus]